VWLEADTGRPHRSIRITVDKSQRCD